MKTLTDDTLNQVARFLKALGEITRLRILRALHDRELTVSDIIRETDATQSNISKHLSVLTSVGILACRKEGTSIYYRVADQNITTICDTVCRSIADKIIQGRNTLNNIRKGVVL